MVFVIEDKVKIVKLIVQEYHNMKASCCEDILCGGIRVYIHPVSRSADDPLLCDNCINVNCILHDFIVCELLYILRFSTKVAVQILKREKFTRSYNAHHKLDLFPDYRRTHSSIVL